MSKVIKHYEQLKFKANVSTEKKRIAGSENG